MHRPIHFEIHVPDPAAVIKFYEKTLGWKFSPWPGPEEYWLISTGGGDGIDGGLMRSRDGLPRTVNTVEVQDVDEHLKAVERAGGKMVVPMMVIPGVGYLAYCTDPGGNIFGVVKRDREAKAAT